MLKIVDTYNEIIQLRNSINGDISNTFSFWEAYISAYPEIKEKCLKNSAEYDFHESIEPLIINAVTMDFSKLEIAHKHFIEVLESLEKRYQEVFPINEDIYIVFYLGLGNGAGWVTSIDSQQTILLGVEKIVELGWHDKDSMLGLIYHELCHVAHSVLRQQSLSLSFSTEKEQGIWQLYIEGFAQRYEQLLYQEEFYHQDKDGWLSWCQANHKQICKEYLDRIRNNTSTQDFFGDWVNYKGYSDVGYYLGCEFVKSLGKEYSISELATLGMPELERLVVGYLGSF